MRSNRACLLLLLAPQLDAFNLPVKPSIKVSLSSSTESTADFTTIPSNTESSVEITTEDKYEEETFLSFVSDVFSDDKAQAVNPNRDFGEKSESLPFVSKPKNLAGYVGDVGFDPLGFSDSFSMDYLREAELKHGRIASLAWFGWVAVDLGVKFDFGPDAEIQAATSAAAAKALGPKAALASHPDGFWNSPLLKGVFLISLIECFTTDNTIKMLNKEEFDRPAGDLNFDVLKILKGKSEAEIEKMKLMEIKNVRLGMFAFFGVFYQSVVLGCDTFPYIKW